MMSIDFPKWVAILAALLLIPGILFLAIVVIYVAFIGPRKKKKDDDSG